MRKTILALPLVIAALVCATGATAASSDKSDAMVPVNQFVDGLNKGDAKSAVAACADETSIIDEFPPHVWNGSGACQKWIDDFGADAQKKGLTKPLVTLGKPRHVDVTGDRAYVVVPATYSYTLKGKAMKEPNCTLTVALQKAAAGWRIAAWSWSKN